ncbi:MAG: aldehyde dehydrogenase (NAD+) [Saprospiraceae bacterium]|jgi:aldehyde dehydrogenase (NAD+)
MQSETMIQEVPIISITEINRIFEAQKENAPNVAKTNYRERVAKLKQLQKWLEEHEADIQAAIHADFQKSAGAVTITELIPIYGELNHTIKNLRNWMQRTKVATPLPLLGTNSYIQYEPKGTCLIISPWNYPFLLAIHPMISAIASGNTMMIKPSELTSNTSALIYKLVAKLFDENEIAVIEGGVEASQALLAKPFNHIFFTGSPRVGKIVMKAAAEHLASVTLELGGKSPTIVDRTANMYTAGEKIAWGKATNNGQTCTAPDYLLVEASVKNKLIEHLIKGFNRMLNPDGKGIKNSPDYARIINGHHFNRLKGLLEDAVEKGAKIEFGGEMDESENYFSPTIISNVTDDMRIMHEEIFGPILPVTTFEKQEDALNMILSRPKPLALYIFTKSNRNKEFFLKQTSSGGTVVNDCLIHYAHVNLPFGGVNNSGTGRGGGHFGFIDFSNIRSVLEQKYAQTGLLFPPYNSKVKKLTELIKKWG